MDELVPFESLLELDLATVMEVDGHVVSFVAQPETFRWRDRRGQRWYTPDFLVETKRGQRVYREVKPQRRLERDPTLGGRKDRIVDECSSRGSDYEIWTETEIEREPRLSNARAILDAGRLVGDAAAESAVLQVLRRNAGLATLGDLATRGAGGRRNVSSVLRLAALQAITIDIETEFDALTRVLMEVRR